MVRVESGPLSHRVGDPPTPVGECLHLNEDGPTLPTVPWPPLEPTATHLLAPGSSSLLRFLAMCQPPPSPHAASFWHLLSWMWGPGRLWGPSVAALTGTGGIFSQHFCTRMYQNPVRHQIPTPGGAAKAEGIILSRAGGATCGASKWGLGSFLRVTPSKASPGFHRF